MLKALYHEQYPWQNALPRLLFASLLLASTSLFAHPQGAPWLDKLYIERSFYDIALQAEYPFERIPPVVKRWARPLRVWVYSGAGNAKQQQALLESHMHRLGRLTGLPVQFVERRRDANVNVFFAADDELQALTTREMSATAYRELKNSVCLGTIRFNRRSEITHGTVLIPVQRAQALGKLDACIVEEVTQMLGLINDSRTVQHTVFSDLTDDDELTALDYLLIKLLYSPYLRSGMNVREAAPLVRHQLDIWELTGEIREADRLVESSAMRLAGR